MSADGCFALIFWRRTRGGEDAKMRGIVSDRRLCPPRPPLPTYCCQAVSQQEASAAFAAYILPISFDPGSKHCRSLVLRHSLSAIGREGRTGRTMKGRHQRSTTRQRTRGHKCARGRRAVKVGVVRRTEGDKKLVQQKRRSPKS